MTGASMIVTVGSPLDESVATMVESAGGAVRKRTLKLTCPASAGPEGFFSQALRLVTRATTAASCLQVATCARLAHARDSREGVFIFSDPRLSFLIAAWALAPPFCCTPV